MRCLSASVGIAATLLAGSGMAQSLCNPCVDPPTGGQNNFSPSGGTTVITDEDMRVLGVVSVADMISQLPENIAAQSPENISADELSEDEASSAAAEEVASGDTDEISDDK